MDYCLAYVTCANKKEAEKIGRELVSEKLAACVNIHEKMTSIYMWHGSVSSEDECLLVAKTKSKVFKTLVEKVCSLHSYTTPCVLQIPMEIGSQAYKEFVDQNTL